MTGLTDHVNGLQLMDGYRLLRQKGCLPAQD